MNIKDKVSKKDTENARLDRHGATNPSNAEPGMEDIDGLFEAPPMDTGGTPPSGVADMFNTGSQNALPPTGGAAQGWGAPPMGSPFGGGQFGSQIPQAPQPNKSDEMIQEIKDASIEVATKAYVSVAKAAPEFFKSFSELGTGKHRVKMGKNLCIVSFTLLAIAVLIIWIVLGKKVLGGQMLIACGVSFLAGLFFTAFSTEKAKEEEAQEIGQDLIPQPQEQIYGSDEEFYDEDDSGGLFGEEDDEDEGSLFGDEDEEDIGFGGFTEEAPADIESSIASVDIDKGMVTRQYIFEKVNQVLRHTHQNFAATKVIDEEHEDFDSYDAIIQQAANLQKPKTADDVPYLKSARETVFFVRLEIFRVNWLKDLKKFTDEIIALCSMNRDTGVREGEGMYGTFDAAGDSIYVTIMKGDTATVSLKDCYMSTKDWVLNTSNYIPIMLGIDIQGKVVTVDFKSIESLLVAGMPRSGKSWTVQAILFQMMLYLSPSDLNIYICDPKEGISDFKAVDAPHVRGFASDNKEILKLVRDLVKNEGPRRQRVIGGAGEVNIWDYKKKNPDIDLPLIYLVIDEVVTLAESMDKETKDEFQSLLIELVTRLPALGIRVFMIPHMIKDQILKKTMTDVISCRMSVRGNAAHIESTLGVKESKFKYELTHQGDMAVLLLGEREAKFVHSTILSKTNDENRQLLEWLRKFWLKIEPNSLHGSLYEKSMGSQEMKEMLNNVHKVRTEEEDAIDLWANQ